MYCSACILSFVDLILDSVLNGNSEELFDPQQRFESVLREQTICMFAPHNLSHADSSPVCRECVCVWSQL